MSTDKLRAAVTGGAQAPNPSNRVINPFDRLRGQIMSRREDFAQIVGKARVDVFIQAVLTAVAHNPVLLEADRASLMLACRKAALDHLMPDGKEAVLNIYNTNVGTRDAPRWVKAVQYLPMVLGLVRALWRTGDFVMIDAVAVYEKDHFSYRRGDDPRIEHEPFTGTEDPGFVIAAYFVGKMKSGEIKREVMFRRDIEKARLASKTPDKGPWVDWYDQMSIKSVLHRVSKQLDLAPEVQGVLERDMKTALGEDMAELMQITPLGAPVEDPGASPIALPETAGGERPPETRVETPEPIPATGVADTPAAAQPAGPAEPDAPDFADALSMVGKGEYGLAREIAGALGKRPEIDLAIKERDRARGGK